VLTADVNPIGLMTEKVVEPGVDQGVHPEKISPDETNQELFDAYPAPTEEERSILRKIPDSIPWVAYSLCCVEAAERASYYGAQTVFNNFM
jgi:hypothetical protein